MSGWQTIDTAPKDGTSVLLFGKWCGEISGPATKNSIGIGYFGDGTSDYAGNDWWVIDGGDAYACWMQPSHWMPLPEPPNAP